VFTAGSHIHSGIMGQLWRLYWHVDCSADWLSTIDSRRSCWPLPARLRSFSACHCHRFTNWSGWTLDRHCAGVYCHSPAAGSDGTVNCHCPWIYCHRPSFRCWKPSAAFYPDCSCIRRKRSTPAHHCHRSVLCWNQPFCRPGSRLSRFRICIIRKPLG
jgi:hypothetical protein